MVTVVAAGLAACGGTDDSGGPKERTESPSLAPTAEPTSMPTPTAEGPPTASAPSAPTPPPDATGPEAEPGGAGDEEAARSRLRVVVDGEGITPPRVKVPAFLAVRITVRNDLPRRVTVAVRGVHPPVRVRARSTRSFNADGLQRGEYQIDAGAAGRGMLVAR